MWKKLEIWMRPAPLVPEIVTPTDVRKFIASLSGPGLAMPNHWFGHEDAMGQPRRIHQMLSFRKYLSRKNETVLTLTARGPVSCAELEDLVSPMHHALVARTQTQVRIQLSQGQHEADMCLVPHPYRIHRLHLGRASARKRTNMVTGETRRVQSTWMSALQDVRSGKPLSPFHTQLIELSIARGIWEQAHEFLQDGDDVSGNLEKYLCGIDTGNTSERRKEFFAALDVRLLATPVIHGCVSSRGSQKSDGGVDFKNVRFQANAVLSQGWRVGGNRVSGCGEILPERREHQLADSLAIEDLA